MRRKWVFILTIALLMTLASADRASAKHSRSGRTASREHVRRESHRARGRHELSRHERRSRETLALRRGRHGRYIAESRHSRRRRYESPYRAPEASVSRPASGGISSERVTEIQNALIKAGYMQAPASGQYDEATTQAMKQYQAANGLPPTGLPSAPLLKKLGVSKRTNDGYAVPVNAVTESEKKRPPQ
jgi:murein L,D-transpeptidase YcbB/YkuD